MNADSMVPEALVEELSYDVNAAALAFIQSHGTNDECIKEANLAITTIKNNVAAQTKAFSELADGSQCHLENQSQLNLAVAKSKQAEGTLAASQKAACLCNAQKGHAAMVANDASASAGDDRLYTVSEQILCTINKDDCKKSATPKAVVKPLVETAIKAECKR